MKRWMNDRAFAMVWMPPSSNVLMYLRSAILLHTALERIRSRYKIFSYPSQNSSGDGNLTF